MRPIFVPRHEVTLPGGLVAPPQAIKLPKWQAHIVKHPMGVGKVRDGHPWSAEGWDKTEPPVITTSQRDGLAGRITALAPDGARCPVRELRGGRSPKAEPCRTCEPPLLHLCAAILNEAESVGRRYAATIEALLQEVAERTAVVVPRSDLFHRLSKSLIRPAWIEAGTVLAVGTDKGMDMVRIARADGTRADFSLNGNGLRWCTTYRVPQASPYTRVSFLMEQFAPAPKLPLSDLYVVPGGWWEAYGR
jgi:hypothetical protein